MQKHPPAREGREIRLESQTDQVSCWAASPVSLQSTIIMVTRITAEEVESGAALCLEKARPDDFSFHPI